jgi:hypothetical protein
MGLRDNNKVHSILVESCGLQIWDLKIHIGFVFVSFLQAVLSRLEFQQQGKKEKIKISSWVFFGFVENQFWSCNQLVGFATKFGFWMHDHEAELKLDPLACLLICLFVCLLACLLAGPGLVYSKTRKGLVGRDGSYSITNFASQQHEWPR